MKVKAGAVAAIATAGALGAGIVPAGAASKGTKVACSVHLQEQTPLGKSAPNPFAGEDLGTVACSKPLGQGVQLDHFKMKAKTPPPNLTGTGVVKFRDFFDAGTISGVWTLKWSGTSPADLKFKIVKVTLTKGTGVFSGITGTGTGSGHLPDATHGQFKWTANITRL